jgi:hypothetical protein
MKLTTKDKIIIVLLAHPYSAIHEISQYYMDGFYHPIKASENNIGTRLSEMRHGHEFQGKNYFLEGRKRQDKPFSEWWVVRVEGIGESKPGPVEIKEQMGLNI